MTLPLVLSIPHCGTEIPSDIAKDLALSPAQTDESEDVGTREIFSGLPALAVLTARWSRLVVDLNRPSDDLGPKGVIARADYFGRPVFKPGFEPNQTETRRRVELYYRPYHQLLKERLALPGLRLLLDCHSMDGVGPADAPDPGRTRAEVNLGNNGGPGGEADPSKGPVTCPPALMRGLAEAMQAEGLSVSFNNPYAGGFITRQYGSALAKEGKASLQIELNKVLYQAPQGSLDPKGLAATRQALKTALEKFCNKL